MFGKNEVTKQNLDDGNKLKVIEVFHTIQGEGPFAGQPAVFIRLAGCNLKCYFCDTDFTTNAQEALVNDIASVVASYYTTKLVVITGGEPLLQNILPLLNALVNINKTVQIETAGTVWVPGLEYYIENKDVHLVCSPKTGKVNSHVRNNCKHWKYIISCSDRISRADGLPMNSTQQVDAKCIIARPGPCATVYLQPMDEQEESINQENIKLVTELALEFGYQVSLQQHKILGVD